VLGCFGPEPQADAAAGAPAELQDKLGARNAARRGKDWATADRLRDEIAAAGWRIVDTPQGARLERA
jgi:cysteinyl-tRNA synthetase